MFLSHVEFVSFDDLGAEISRIKGSPGQQTGETHWDTPNGHIPKSPGGECFAPLESKDVNEKNDHKLHSFLRAGPAIFPASIISSHACIVLLLKLGIPCLNDIFSCLYSIALEANSMSHVYFQPCTSAQNFGL